ncbi:MAG: hypothetical protein AAF789_08705 [Bacteroidota bacterium]
MKIWTVCLIVLLSSSCYKRLELEGFEKARWVNDYYSCEGYREDIADYLIEKQDVLLEGTQNEVESLLGTPKEHELYNRNQKFFHYRISPPDSCGNLEAVKYLSIRFNGLGRANLVQVMLREPQ